MQSILGFVELYLSPIIIAVGLVYFFWGVVNYFLVGPSYEEDRKEIGRKALLWAMVYIFVGIAVYGVVRWVADVSERMTDEVRIESREKEDVLPVPNVPSVE